MKRLVLLLALCALLLPAAPAAAASVATAAVRTVKAGQGKIGYRSVGQGRPLVMIMGLSGTMDAWDPAFVDALAAHRRVIVFDNEGIRRSTLGKGQLTIRRMADDTASLIRALRLRRADVLGWSMGGMIAQSLARRHPGLVRRMVLCATAPGDGRATAPTAETLAQLNSADPGALLGILFPADPAALQAYASGLARYPNLNPMAPAAVTQAQFNASATWMAGLDPQGRPLSRLRLPVLVGGGELDALLPVANQRHLASAIPGATLRTYADGGHGFLFQHGAEFAGEIDRFLNRR